MKGEETVKRISVFLLSTLIMLSLFTSCDLSEYPASGAYISEDPYFSFTYAPSANENTTAEMDYMGNTLPVELFIGRGNTFHLSGDFMSLGSHGDLYGTWKLDDKGNILLIFDKTYDTVQKEILLVKQLG